MGGWEEEGVDFSVCLSCVEALVSDCFVDLLCIFYGIFGIFIRVSLVKVGQYVPMQSSVSWFVLNCHLQSNTTESLY